MGCCSSSSPSKRFPPNGGFNKPGYPGPVQGQMYGQNMASYQQNMRPQGPYQQGYYPMMSPATMMTPYSNQQFGRGGQMAYHPQYQPGMMIPNPHVPQFRPSPPYMPYPQGHPQRFNPQPWPKGAPPQKKRKKKNAHSSFDEGDGFEGGDDDYQADNDNDLNQGGEDHGEQGQFLGNPEMCPGHGQFEQGGHPQYFDGGDYGQGHHFDGGHNHDFGGHDHGGDFGGHDNGGDFGGHDGGGDGGGDFGGYDGGGDCGGDGGGDGGGDCGGDGGCD